MDGTKTPDHHGDHRRLLWQADETTPLARVDAIIVPTSRPLKDLKEAAHAARFLGCPLVTLHSPGRTSASEADAYFDRSVDLVAIDVPEPAQLRLPVLETSRLLAGTIFERRTDVSTKRNLALVLSHMLRWRHVVFLDDDIRVPDPADLSRAVSLLGTHTAVGLRIGGFPDNSVVCHAFRDVGGWQDTFIGGGALAVDVKRNRTFFPNIYNEDWFFVLDAGKRLQSVAIVGQVLQEAYDPYRPERARAEELGDVLAEGTFWLLDQDRSASEGDLAHWREFLTKRKRFIGRVIGMVEHATDIEAAERTRRVEALNAALGRLARITPELCVAYHKALVVDQERWQRHIQAIRQQPKPRRELALELLARRTGGRPLTWYTRTATSLEPRRGTPRMRPVQARELQSAILPPPPALAPRMVTVAKRALPPFLRRGSASSHAAHALEAAKVALACQEGQAEGDDHSDECPSQQLHV
ncbi:MAG TPA: hypothetical protein VFJ07_19660 [Streptosporangiaceae bacterium]|nr:hypothetical protein [Streptosporangiaceae bacterium]